MQTEPMFKKLFEPIQIKNMKLKNRIVMAPMGCNYASADGFATDQMIDYYAARARGGAGLIIVEATTVQSPVGRVIARQLAIDDDKYLPGLSKLARVIKDNGAKAGIQFQHGGNASKRSITGVRPVAPSAVPRESGGAAASEDLPKELSIDEIVEVIACFVKAAEQAKAVGFDCIQIHGAHRYLIAQFLSAHWNRRQDAYGGDLNGRARLLLDIVKYTREAVGNEYPILCRINGHEMKTSLSTFREPGLFEIDEAKAVSRMLVEAGVDCIDVSITPLGPATYYTKRGWAAHLAADVKKEVAVPIIAVGRLDPKVGDRLIREGKTDLVNIGRALVADPDLPNKAAAGRMRDVIPCLSCNTCLHSIYPPFTEPMVCATNATVGRESELAIRPAAVKKKVVVIGGGPAGMEAARVAALRGHDVLLYEKAPFLGGQLRLSGNAPHTHKAFANYLRNQLNALGVPIALGQQVTPALIEEIGPDAAIVATGVVPTVPEIAGADRKPTFTAMDVLGGQPIAGDRTVVIGGELVGCEVADYLGEIGKQVTIVTRGAEIGSRIGFSIREVLLKRLEARRTAMLTGTRCEEITEDGLVITTSAGAKLLIEADSIVFATGAAPDRTVFKALQGRVKEIYAIGDCVKPRRIVDAVREGYECGLRV